MGTNPFAVEPNEGEQVRFEQEERLAAIRACRVTLVAVAPVLACSAAAEYAVKGAHRLGLRGAAALVAVAALVYLAIAWHRVGTRCRPVAARAARLGILIQALVHGAFLAFLLLWVVG